MDYFTDALPKWISIAFLVAITIPVYLVAYLAKTGMKNLMTSKQASNYFYGIIGFYFVYFIYVTIACFKGLFAHNSLPPRIMVISALPLLLFYIGIILNLPMTKKILKNIELTTLVSVHLFRLIGSFFVIMGLYQAIPKTFAFIAGFGDILIALSSIAVATALMNKRSYAKKLTWIWNTLGLIDILGTSFMAFWFTKQSIETGSLGVTVLTEFPFCFIPSFAPATIIFLHICIYKKLLSKSTY